MFAFGSLYEGDLAGNHVEYLVLVVDTGILEIDTVEPAISSLHLSGRLMRQVLHPARKTFGREYLILVGDDAEALFSSTHLFLDLP